jgi:superfamily II DNA/RNA helicase
MRQLENKNIVLDLQSKKCSWEDLKVPDPIKHVLEELKMNRPSIIQAHAIPRVND